MNGPHRPAFGKVVLVKNLVDPQGRNSKPLRPCVVVTTDEEIVDGRPIAVVGISTLKPGPQPPNSVLLPFHRQGRSRTGFTTRCAAFAAWVAIIELDRIEKVIGHVPATEMRTLIDLLNRQI
jgi:mRNA-degrading endonuclease toxin of MazEF toxin-antitoxin module